VTEGGGKVYNEEGVGSACGQADHGEEKGITMPLKRKRGKSFSLWLPKGKESAARPGDGQTDPPWVLKREEGGLSAHHDATMRRGEREKELPREGWSKARKKMKNQRSGRGRRGG